MNLRDLSYSREQAVTRLASNRVFRKRVASMLLAARWDELLLLPSEYGVSWDCIRDTLDFLYGMRFDRWGGGVCRLSA
jgi:hypothetical protein